MEHVILVDTNDTPIGTMEKMEAHKLGLLHRAFSVFIFNSRGEFLLQQRALDKYHSGGLWTNTCCSHPRPDEDIEMAAQRRLREEMGLDCFLVKGFSFIYKITFDNGLTEHELDYVFIGQSDDAPAINPGEANDWKYISEKDLREDILKNPGNYTEWFKIIIGKIFDHFYQGKQP